MLIEEGNGHMWVGFGGSDRVDGTGREWSCVGWTGRVWSCCGWGWPQEHCPTDSLAPQAPDAD